MKMLHCKVLFVPSAHVARSPFWLDLKFKPCVCETGFNSLETYSGVCYLERYKLKWLCYT